MAEDNDKYGMLKPGDPRMINPALVPNAIYANGFAGGPSPTDIYIVGLLNGRPDFVLNMSFTTAKALQQLMNVMIEKMETDTGITIPTADEMSQKLSAGA